VKPPFSSPRPIGNRGVALNEKQIARIQALLNSDRVWTREELAREICRKFGWRRLNGTLAVRRACQQLTQLDRLGAIQLPSPRRTQGRPDRMALRAAAAALPERNALTEASRRESTNSNLLVRPIRAGEMAAWRAHMERFHYLGDGALVGESLRYVAEQNGEWIALLGWCAAALRNSPRDQYLKWEESAKKARLNLVVNNARFLMLKREPNLASRVLSANLRRLNRDFEQIYGHRVLLAETFVDTSRFRGICYRASNWIYVGETKGWSRNGSAYRFNGQPKAVWIYPLAHDFKEKLCACTNATDARKKSFAMLDIGNLPLHGEGGLFDLLCEFNDPRKRRGIRHKIQSVLATAICAVLAGACSFAMMAEWAAEQSKETLIRLGSKRGKPPSKRTYQRVFDSIDVAELDRQTGQWIANQLRLQPKVGLALDGKTARGSRDGEVAAVQLLSAVVHGSGTVVAQVAVESKTNEIPKVEPLLNELNLKGVVVTADALHTQTKTATYLVKQKEADYVFTVKDNQPTLKQDIETLSLNAFPPSAYNSR
jgi:hypothetical protein